MCVSSPVLGCDQFDLGFDRNDCRPLEVSANLSPEDANSRIFTALFPSVDGQYRHSTVRDHPWTLATFFTATRYSLDVLSVSCGWIGGEKTGARGLEQGLKVSPRSYSP